MGNVFSSLKCKKRVYPNFFHLFVHSIPDVRADAGGGEVIGAMGDCEHLRVLLPLEI